MAAQRIGEYVSKDMAFFDEAGARVKRFLDESRGLANARLSDDDQTPVIYLAMETKSKEIVQLLLEYGVNWQLTTRTGATHRISRCFTSSPRHTPEIFFDKAQPKP